jgi:hypothetical protein
MRKRLVWVAVPLGLVAGAASRLRHRSRHEEKGPDPRAEELKQRLDESRSLVSERDEFESGETPIDAVEDRRRAVHEHARNTIDEIRPQDG